MASSSSTYKFQKPKRPVSRVFIHCSASDNPDFDNVATMDLWHRQRGWSQVGYHLFIRKSGLIEVGRSLELVPAAQQGNNSGTIAICLHGLEEQKFTDEQLQALIVLCHQINQAYRGDVTFHGHCEVAAKACPVINYKAILDLRVGGSLPLSVKTSAAVLNTNRLPADANLDEPEVDSFTKLQIGDKSGAVHSLQKALANLGYFPGAVDGEFGQRTRAAVLAFQADNHLVPDGVFGPASREAFKEAKPRAVSAARSAATIMSLASGGSRIASSSVNGGVAGLILASGGMVEVLNEVSGAVSQVAGAGGVITEILNRFGSYTGAAVVALGLFVAWQSWNTARARLEDHQTGKTA